MAIIPLRAYNHEIEGMIDNGQLDEAVAHCRHILATFPKYIATYRLLGKAHLEQQRISDATDIFQRVLTSMPDDIIANVGMSIIREDENNLDSAIWHMELAYEAQSANIAIQDELRRLYGRRDGTQPFKPRLTRGALARMYAKGGLYDQAIAELRAAIGEEPNRVDLQMLLAEMYFQTSQRVEAVETCANVIKKNPYCLEANRILAVSLPDAENSETVRNYRQIVISMDPYFAYAQPEAISSDDVPENAVNIERLDYKSGIQAPEPTIQPNWATSLGISLDKPIDESIPDWLKSSEAPPPIPTPTKGGGGVSPFVFDTDEAEKIISDTSKPVGEIPDWMKDAGWQHSSGEPSQPPVEPEPEMEGQVIPVDQPLEKAEIPDWLQGIAPEGALDEGKSAEEPAENTLSTPWLEQHEPGPTDSIIHWLEDNKPEKPRSKDNKEEALPEIPEDEVPDWLKDLEPAEAPPTPPVVSPAATSAFTIDPSAFIDATSPIDAEGTATPAEPPAAGTVPQADGGLPGLPPAEPAAEGEEEVPDWLKELAGEPIAEASLSAQETPPADGTQVAELQAAEEIQPAAEELTLGETVAEELPSMELPIEPGTAAGQPAAAAPEEELPGTVEALAPVEGIPVEEIALPAAPPAVEPLPEAETTITPEAVPAEALPDWLEEVAPSEPGPAVEEIPAAQAASAVEMPAAAEATPAEGLPSWIEDQAEEVAAAPEGGVPTEQIPPAAETPAVELAPAKALPTWIEEQAEVVAAAPEVGAPTEEVPPAVETPAIEIAPAKELPTWIEEHAEVVPAAPEVGARTEEVPPAVETPAIEPAFAEEVPSWMEEISKAVTPGAEEVTPAEPAPVPVETAAPAEALASEDIPSWMQEFAQAEATTPVEAQPAGEAPPLAEIPPASSTTPGEALAPAEAPVLPTEVPIMAQAGEPGQPSEVEAPAGQLPAFEQPPAAEEIAATGQPAIAQGEMPPPEVGKAGELEAFAWLEGLAAEQSAKAEATPTPQEAGQILPPDWVKLDAEPPADETVLAESQVPTGKTVPAEEVPDWIKGLGEAGQTPALPAEPEAAAVPEVEATQSEELPAWLRELEEPEPQKGSGAQAEEELEWKPEELPAWLKEITEEETPAATPAPATVVPAEAPAAIEPEAVEVPALEEVPIMQVPSVLPEVPAAIEPEVVVAPTVEEAPVVESASVPVEVPAAIEPESVEVTTPGELPAVEAAAVPAEAPAAIEPQPVEVTTPEELPAVETAAIPAEAPVAVETAPVEVPVLEEAPAVPAEVPAAIEPQPVEVTTPEELPAVETAAIPAEAPVAEEAAPVEVPVLEEAPAVETSTIPAEAPAAVEAALVEVPAPEEVPAVEAAAIPAEAPSAIEPEPGVTPPAAEVPMQLEAPAAVVAPLMEEVAAEAQIPAAEEVLPVEAIPLVEAIPPVEPAPSAQEVAPVPLEAVPEWSGEMTPPAGIMLEALAETPVEVSPEVVEQPAPAEAEMVTMPEAAAPLSEQVIAPPAEIETAQPEEKFEALQAVSMANQETLGAARRAVSQGDPAKAVELYKGLVMQNYHLDEVIKDLEEALYRFPVETGLWVTLGGAHFRSEDLPAALAAYNKAEELVR